MQKFESQYLKPFFSKRILIFQELVLQRSFNFKDTYTSLRPLDLSLNAVNEKVKTKVWLSSP